MKIPLFSKLTARPRGRKVVRASARAMRGGEDEYYEAEPNMKLSHAFMVVLILHVVAVGGIYAFNHIKVNRKSDLIANISGKIAQATGGVTTSAALVAEPAAVAQRLPGDADEPLPAMRATPAMPAPVVNEPAVVSTKPAAAPAAMAPAVTQTAPPKAEVKQVAAATKPAPATTAATTSAAAPGTYKVAKGDNPYNIAKKFGVSYQELLKVNGIEDPTKLQIGQVLKVPSKAN
jgi:LysM repeat protein